MSHYKPYPVYKGSGVEWLGRIPESWKVSRLGFEAWVRARLGWKGLKADEYVDDGYVFLSTPDIKGAQINFSDVNFITEGRYEESPEIKLRVGDVLLAKDGSTLGTVNVVRDLPRAATVNSSIAVITPYGELHGLYLLYLFKGAYLENTIQVLKGGMGVPHLFQWDINKFKIPLPSLVEQAEIAIHLDRETARIDGLVERKTRFIELLREKRQALIIHAATKGLDPTVKMKDSGVEWLGEVPEHWGIKQLKHVVDPNSSITYGIVQAGPEFEGGVPYIRTSDMSADALPILGYPLTSPEIDESYARSRVRPGDIVMSIRASVGKCLPVPDGLTVANLTQGTAKVSPGKCITQNFLLKFLNSGAAQVYFDLMAKGATFKEITLDALRRTPVVLPPRDEQVEIDQYIARHVGRLDQLRQLTEQSIAMLKERRSALITAAVSGQIDLREAV